MREVEEECEIMIERATQRDLQIENNMEERDNQRGRGS